MRYAQLVIGPAGSGKTTYCKVIQEYLQACKRSCYLVNLDPCIEVVERPKRSKLISQPEEATYDLDIRELINIDTVVDELGLGPNGALLHSIEVLNTNIQWLSDSIEERYPDESYLVIDTPGQIELYVHLPYMYNICKLLSDLNINTIAVFLLDVTFLNNHTKLIAGLLTSLASMVSIQTPHINILSKCDLIAESNLYDKVDYMNNYDMMVQCGELPEKYQRLNRIFLNLLEEYNLINFVPLNIEEEESIEGVMAAIDVATQYGEEKEVETRDF